jgi:prepilin peptidase dependent protein B
MSAGPHAWIALRRQPSGARYRARRAVMRSVQRGLTLVELMVGVTVGLFIVAAASLLVANQLTDTRILTLETQISADLRATADIVSREIRRAGSWNSARQNVWFEGATGVTPNPYAGSTTPDVDGALTTEVSLAYSRSVRESGVGSDDDSVTADEVSGFRLQDETIQAQLGDGNWQALTDPAVLRVTQFDVSLVQRERTLACWQECPPGAPDCPPRLALREFTVTISGQAVADANVRRTVRVTVRPRNDVVIGSCP